jgi:hypothetical protein
MVEVCILMSRIMYVFTLRHMHIKSNIIIYISISGWDQIVLTGSSNTLTIGDSCTKLDCTSDIALKIFIALFKIKIIFTLLPPLKESQSSLKWLTIDGSNQRLTCLIPWLPISSEKSISTRYFSITGVEYSLR